MPPQCTVDFDPYSQKYGGYFPYAPLCKGSWAVMTRPFLLLLHKYSEVSEASVQLFRESSESSPLVKPHYYVLQI